MLPDNVSFQTVAPLACAGVTVWGGLVRAGLKAGETVAIVGGGGGLGHLGVQFAKALGLHVIAIDARDEALSLAKECGADTLVDARSGKEKVVEEVKKVTRGQGADATLNVSDHESAAATKMYGTLLLCSELLFMQVILICSRNSRTDSSANECERPISGASLSRHKDPWQSYQ
jgi:alcohol dehydrogenase, propanol-preferring